MSILNFMNHPVYSISRSISNSLFDHRKMTYGKAKSHPMTPNIIK